MGSKKEVTLIPLAPTDKDLEILGEVDDLTALDGTGREFSAQGLYSVQIFNAPGSKERMNTFGYIKLKTYILHPNFYIDIISLDSKFKLIVNSKLNVKLDKSKGEFIEDDDGDTGFNFFIKSIPFLKFKRNSSKQRDEKIDSIHNYIKLKKYKISNLYVLPAGMRDYELKEKGLTSEDEINDFYKNVIRDKRLVGSFDLEGDDISIIDPIRLKLQTDIVELYKYIMSLLDGKNKLMRGKWIKRGITHGTRNVFSGIPSTITDLKDSESGLNVDETILGVLQTSAAFLPLTLYKLKVLFINDMFSLTDYTGKFYNPKTYKETVKEIKKKTYEQWTTTDGFYAILNRAISDEIKNSPIMIEGNVFKPIFDNGKEIELIDNIEDIPKEDLEHVRPLTYGELLFFLVKDISKEYPVTITRHPVIEDGSTYYSRVRLYTTNDFRRVVNRKTNEVYNRYCILGSAWINTTGLHYTRLEGLTADFDGDKGTILGYLTKDAAEEAKRDMNSTGFYVSPSGKARLKFIDDISVKIIKTLTKKDKLDDSRIYL